jgi:hypothetical protein
MCWRVAQLMQADVLEWCAVIRPGRPGRLLSGNDTGLAGRPQADQYAADYPRYLGGRPSAAGPPRLLSATKGPAQIWV